MATYNTAVQGPVQGNNVSITMQTIRTDQQPVKLLRNVEDPIMTFVGRQNLLGLVKKKLDSCPPSGNWIRRVTVLQGFGGMGKSELARKFCQQYRDEYPNVAWIDAEKEASLKKSFEAVADILNLPRHEAHTTKELAELANRVFRHVRDHVPRALFIYDNANCLRGDANCLKGNARNFGIFEFLPKQSHANSPLVLVTSRTTEWRREKIEVIEVDALSNKESVEFFQKRFDVVDEQLVQDERLNRLLQELSEHLQGYPLGVQLAAGYICYIADDDPISMLYTELKAFTEKVSEELSKDVLDMKVVTASDYRRTFSKVWKLTMERLRQSPRYSEALHLLLIMAYCDPDAMSPVELERTFNSSSPDGLDRPVDSSRFDYAKKPLIQLALVRANDSNIARTKWLKIHRVIQKLARRDDKAGIGLCSLLKAKNFERVNNYLVTRSKVNIPPSVLESDKLTITWLKLLGSLLAYKPSYFQFEVDDTLRKQLQDRNCCAVGDILIRATFIKAASISLRPDGRLIDRVLLVAIFDLEAIGRGSNFSGDLCTILLNFIDACWSREEKARCLSPSALQTFREWLELPTTHELAGCSFDCYLALQAIIFRITRIVGTDKYYEDYGYNRADLEFTFLKVEKFKPFQVAPLSIQMSDTLGLLSAEWNLLEFALGQYELDRNIIDAYMTLRIFLEHHPDSLAPLKEKMKMRIQASLKGWLQRFQSAESRPEIEEKPGGIFQEEFRSFNDVGHHCLSAHKFIFDHCGSKHLFCIKKDPTCDEAHQPTTSDDLETTSMALYMGYMNCYALALKEHSVTTEPLENLLHFWLPDQHCLRKLPQETRIPLSVFPVMWAVDWDFQKDLDALTRVQVALSAIHGDRLATHCETVETLRHYTTGLIKIKEYFDKLDEHLQKWQASSLKRGGLFLWVIEWMVLYTSSDTWMTHFR